MYMVKQNFYILSIVVLFFLIALNSWARDSASKVLPETKNTMSHDKKSLTDSADEKSDLEDNESEEEEAVEPPDENFKLLAIYLVGNKPRALIKNLDKPEEPAREYQVGDYVDDSQIFSVSKILLNPTLRIELVDSNGLSYIVKPKNTDNMNNPAPLKSSPSYSGGYKTKIKKAATSTARSAGETTSSGAPSAQVKSSEKKEDAASLESAIKNDAAPAASTITTPPPSAPAPTQLPPGTTTPPPGLTQPSSAPAPSEQIQNTNSPAPSQAGGAAQPQTNVPPMGTTDYAMSGSGASDSLNTSRPSNPFGE